MSTYEKWDSQEDFRTQGAFSPMLGAENVSSNNSNNEFITNELSDVAWQTECKIGFNHARDSSGFSFSVYNGSEKEALYRCVCICFLLLNCVCVCLALF
ncbi:hypothetical protein AVEN_24984-1 [Araneus ventricosus]|uniref:Uncharacterized protein n=1 Tax=Araneus ventricosus TaxID=182803 RepID=A0A4Y2RQN9_ARAVE|nr:hypothetical protein AVEN_24984-1 [Araneus ventricosus]